MLFPSTVDMHYAFSKYSGYPCDRAFNFILPSISVWLRQPHNLKAQNLGFFGFEHLFFSKTVGFGTYGSPTTIRFKQNSRLLIRNVNERRLCIESGCMISVGRLLQLLCAFTCENVFLCGEIFTTALRREIYHSLPARDSPKWFAARYFLDGSSELPWEELSPGTSQSASYSGFQKMEKVAKKASLQNPLVEASSSWRSSHQEYLEPYLAILVGHFLARLDIFYPCIRTGIRQLSKESRSSPQIWFWWECQSSEKIDIREGLRQGKIASGMPKKPQDSLSRYSILDLQLCCMAN